MNNRKMCGGKGPHECAQRRVKAEEGRPGRGEVGTITRTLTQAVTWTALPRKTHASEVVTGLH